MIIRIEYGGDDFTFLKGTSYQTLWNIVKESLNNERFFFTITEKKRR